MPEVAYLVATGRLEHGMGRVVRGGGARPQRRSPLAIEGVNGGAHRLSVAPEECGDEPRMWPTAAGEHNLTAAPGHMVGRP